MSPRASNTLSVIKREYKTHTGFCDTLGFCTGDCLEPWEKVGSAAETAGREAELTTTYVRKNHVKAK